MTEKTISTLDIETWLTSRIVTYGDLEPETVTIDTPLTELGFNSVYALTLCGDIEDTYGVDVDPTIVWDHPTIRVLSEALKDRVMES